MVEIATRLGPYEILAPLGAGGMGEVYRARDTRLGREVAVKVLPERFADDENRLRRFEQEARAAGALDHPNVLVIHDVGFENGTPYVVSELLEGQTLRELLRRETKLGLDRVLDIALQTARGLSAAHEKGIVHRDLKPENLFLTRDRRLKILDFGLAKLVAPLEASSDLETQATDSWHTEPGTRLGTVGYMAPEQVRGEPSDPRADIFSFGAVLYELLAGKRAFAGATASDTLAAILRDEPSDLSHSGVPPALARLVGRCLEKAPEARFRSAHDLALALEALTPERVIGSREQALEERGPYPGLSSFTEKDAASFFGREAEVEALWARLQACPLSGVIGPSGAGKTSFVRAGIVANAPSGWSCLVCTPGTAAFRGLGQALLPQLTGDLEALSRILSVDDPAVAFELVSRWRRGHGEALLVVDQFEELFTLNPKETWERFAGLLGRLAREADVHVLLSLRDDFLMRCADHAPLARVFESLSPLPALSADGLHQALEQPAEAHGYRFEDEALIAEMVEAVEGARAALPLLAFAVSRLWERRDREHKILTRAAYEQIGGVAGALAQHAEATMDRIGTERQGIVREIFRNLVTAQETRAVADREELLSAFPEREAAEEVLRELIDARLLTSYELDGTEGQPSRHRIEIVHESLIRAWPRLVRWQAQDEEGAVLRDQLRQAAHLWHEKGRTSDILWTGTAFTEFELWRGRYPGALTALEQDFAKAMREKARRHRRIVRAAVSTSFVVLVGIAAAIGLSRQQAARARDRAQAEALRAEASKVLTLAEMRLAEDPTEALALATASLEMADSQEARVFTLKALWEAPPAFEVINGDGQRLPSFSPDGGQLATAGHSPEARVWREDGSGPLVLPGHMATISPLGPLWVSPSRLAVGYVFGGGDRAWVWSLPDGRLERTIEVRAGLDDPVTVAGGRLFHLALRGEVQRGEPNEVELRSWSLPDGPPVKLGRVPWPGWLGEDGGTWVYGKGATLLSRALPVSPGSADRVLGSHPPEIAAVRTLPGHRVLTINRDKERRVWTVEPGRPPQAEVLPMPETAPGGVANVEDSGRWLTRKGDAGVKVWSRGSWTAARPVELRRAADWYMSGWTTAPSGDWLVADTSSHMRLTFWPLRRPQPLVVDGYAYSFRPVIFSPDGRWLASLWAGAEVRLWPLAPGSTRPRLLDVPKGNLWITNMAFDPQGRFLVGAGAEGRVFVVPLDGRPVRRLEGFENAHLLSTPAVSSSGRLVAAAFNYGTGEKSLRVWDLETGAVRSFDLPMPSPIEGTKASNPIGSEGGICNLAFADDSTLYTGGHGGVRRWDLATGSHVVVVEAPPDMMSCMSIRPVNTSDKTLVVFRQWPRAGDDCAPVVLQDLATRSSRPLPALGSCVRAWDVDPTGTVIATGDKDGTVRVARLPDGKPHLLVGHKGVVDSVAVSPDLKWIASSGGDKTLRLWPMPDLSKSPLQSLPRAELVAKLKSLTNLRAVRDPKSSTGWTIELDRFPGWKDVPTW